MTSSGNQTSPGQQNDGAHLPSSNSLPGAAATNSAAATTEESLSVEEKLRKRNAYLQGRVDVLQQQNRQLGHCVHELRSFTDTVIKPFILLSAFIACIEISPISPPALFDEVFMQHLTSL
jgi:hypothetical protein